MRNSILILVISVTERRYVYQLDSLNRVFTENFWEIICNFVEPVRARLHETRSELKPV